MIEINYDEALKLYGDYIKYDKAFIMLKNNECKLYSIDNSNYIYVVNNTNYNMKEVRYNSSLNITKELLDQIKEVINEYIIKIDKNIMQTNILDNILDNYKVLDEELITEDSYAYDIEDHNEEIVIHKVIILVK